MSTKNHYDHHLSPYYSWLYGGLLENVEKNRQFFQKHQISAFASRTAIDLGAGSGFQSLALSQSGFKVSAVDFCQNLLQEIRENNSDIELIEADLLDFNAYSRRNPELFICMGDTLTHLPGIDAAGQLLENCYQELVPKGKIILSFRDLTFELKGKERFIPVKSDDSRLLTCFLEYQSDYLTVYDIINEKKAGQWLQKISSYQKIKISAAKIKSLLNESGFQIDFFNQDKGLLTMIGSKV